MYMLKDLLLFLLYGAIFGMSVMYLLFAFGVIKIKDEDEWSKSSN
jgi:putative effector of murein hydrolase LrgA (UPF0299 family)